MPKDWIANPNKLQIRQNFRQTLVDMSIAWIYEPGVFLFYWELHWIMWKVLIDSISFELQGQNSHLLPQEKRILQNRDIFQIDDVHKCFSWMFLKPTID